MTPTAQQTPLLAALDDAGYKRTAPRRAVADLIARREGHFTAADLIADAREAWPSIGRATIFRMLDTLEALGVLERIDLPSGDHAYVACEPSHHHHCICTGCGASVEVEDEGLQGVVAGIASQTGYRIDSHRLELYGLCPTCRARGAGA